MESKSRKNTPLNDSFRTLTQNGMSDEEKRWRNSVVFSRTHKYTKTLIYDFIIRSGFFGGQLLTLILMKSTIDIIYLFCSAIYMILAIFDELLLNCHWNEIAWGFINLLERHLMHETTKFTRSIYYLQHRQSASSLCIVSLAQDNVEWKLQFSQKLIQYSIIF